MIKLRENGITALFGTGDIHMFSARDEDGNGYLYLHNHHEPQPIGMCVNDVMQYIPQPLFDSEMPVVMKFSKTESIDALIVQLQETKVVMTGKFPRDISMLTEIMHDTE